MISITSSTATRPTRLKTSRSSPFRFRGISVNISLFSIRHPLEFYYINSIFIT